MYTEEIYSLASASCKDDGGQLMTWCEIAEGELASRLRSGVAAEDCRETFIAAAALLAMSMFACADGGDDVKSYRAGDISVTRNVGDNYSARADALRRQSELMMAPYIEDGEFFFRSVRG